MVLRWLFSRVKSRDRVADGSTPNDDPDRAARFLVEAMQALQETLPLGEAELQSFTPTLAQRIWQAAHDQTGDVVEEIQVFEGLRQRLIGAFPDADKLALRWFCDAVGYQRWYEDQMQATGYSTVLARYRLELGALLALWVQREPAPDAADALYDALKREISETTSIFPHHVDFQVGVMAWLEEASGSADLRRGRALLLELAETARQAKDHRAFRRGNLGTLFHSLGRVYGPRLVRAGLLSDDELELVLRGMPRLANPVRSYQFSWSSTGYDPQWDAKVCGVVDRLLQRAVTDGLDDSGRDLLYQYEGYRGIDQFLASCRYLEQHPKEKLPSTSWVSPSDPLGWAIGLLLKIRPPTERDRARGAELSALKADTLLLASLFSPDWATLAEPYLHWPGLGALAMWLKRYGGQPPWSAGQQPTTDDDSAGPGAVDRDALLEAVAQMGEDRVKQLLRHRVARGLYRDALYYLQAVLGWNAADVEAGFVKRTKRAVRALGMLPDEGDVLDRYLALRRFAKEARQFGAQRQASEQLAAESGLANLAVTAGYHDLAQLEWAMEAQLAQEVDPAERRWAIGDYTVYVEPSEIAAIVVERGGKRLKSVPAAVRDAPEYAEIKETRELVSAQFERVRRRLEFAMATGEMMDRQTFSPALTTPAGQAMVSSLVLRGWVEGRSAPVEVLGFRTLADEEIPADRFERVQIAHPFQLAESGTLDRWQRKLVAAELVQPFNQLFREIYQAMPSERGRWRSNRFEGRRVRLGALVEQFKRRGWQLQVEDGLTRRLPGRLLAVLTTNAAPYLPATEIVRVYDLQFLRAGKATSEDVDPLTFSEVLRDVDQATTLAAADRVSAPVSPEVLAVRKALVRALAPSAQPDGGVVRLNGYTVDLESGAVLEPDGATAVREVHTTPTSFPFPNPDPATAAVFGRVWVLTR